MKTYFLPIKPYLVSIKIVGIFFKFVGGLCAKNLRTMTVLVLHVYADHHEARRLGGFTGWI